MRNYKNIIRSKSLQLQGGFPRSTIKDYQQSEKTYQEKRRTNKMRGRFKQCGPPKRSDAIQVLRLKHKEDENRRRNMNLMPEPYRTERQLEE